MELTPLPHIEAYKRDVDRTLLRANLRRSYAERARALEQMQALHEEGQRLRNRGSR